MSTAACFADLQRLDPWLYASLVDATNRIDPNKVRAKLEQLGLADGVPMGSMQVICSRIKAYVLARATIEAAQRVGQKRGRD